MIKIISCAIGDHQIYTAFSIGKETTPEQAYHELIGAIMEYALKVATDVNQSGVGHITCGEVIDKIASDLQVAKTNMIKKMVDNPYVE